MSEPNLAVIATELRKELTSDLNYIYLIYKKNIIFLYICSYKYWYFYSYIQVQYIMSYQQLCLTNYYICYIIYFIEYKYL